MIDLQVNIILNPEIKVMLTQVRCLSSGLFNAIDLHLLNKLI
jgi:hypothetical protein